MCCMCRSSRSISPRSPDRATCPQPAAEFLTSSLTRPPLSLFLTQTRLSKEVRTIPEHDGTKSCDLAVAPPQQRLCECSQNSSSFCKAYTFLTRQLTRGNSSRAYIVISHLLYHSVNTEHQNVSYPQTLEASTCRVTLLCTGIRLTFADGLPLHSRHPFSHPLPSSTHPAHPYPLRHLFS
jgi:hypothetical protein